MAVLDSKEKKSNLPKHAFKPTDSNGITMQQCLFCSTLLCFLDTISNLTAHFRRCSGHPETGFDALMLIDPNETLIWSENFYFCRIGETSTRAEMVKVVEFFTPLWEALLKDSSVSDVRVKKKQQKTEQQAHPTNEEEERTSLKNILQGTEEENIMLRQQLLEAQCKIAEPINMEPEEELRPLQPDSGLNSGINSNPSSREASQEPVKPKPRKK
ncbi:unnamed protein product [Orchesella dallaii]|uniref:Uncharacterized protein n=1 Tax=Orchesella dallaii TaxID=48710 RepID=A0ABP1PR92_9HEXA